MSNNESPINHGDSRHTDKLRDYVGTLGNTDIIFIFLIIQQWVIPQEK